MPQIEVLDQQTIDKIAAGEVIERPASVVKELVENSIDAMASAVTVEIKEGGISFIRITDNGCGMEASQVPLAFLRHSTSKIRRVEDLLTVTSLGFRGEALSSIAAVSQVELITKTTAGISGVRYLIEGGAEKSLEEIGAPEGTTFLVKNLFYNTPARRKFLKTPATEAGYIGDLMERMALSHSEISFKFIVNNQVKLHTSGNSNLKENIYHIFGRDIAANLIPLEVQTEMFSLSGFIGKPLISRGNRNYENYFINGRYIRSSLIAKGIEDGYKSFVMQHKYPFTVLHMAINGSLLDVNVHPTKMELRFRNQEEIYEGISSAVREAINSHELVYQFGLDKEQKKAEKKTEKPGQIPEPFEKKRLEQLRASVQADSPYEPKYVGHKTEKGRNEEGEGGRSDASMSHAAAAEAVTYRQASLKDLVIKEDSPGYGPAGKMDPASDETAGEGSGHSISCKAEGASPVSGERKLLAEESRKYHIIIGQLFETYWLVQFEDKLYIIDQHAAHEKVLYERMMKSLENRDFISQNIYPPILISLSMQEEELLKKYQTYFTRLGFTIEPFGGKEYEVTAVPANLFGINGQELVLEILDGLIQFNGRETPQIVTEKIASMSCKAAVKGNQRLLRPEMERLIDELLTLENPYHCPHGRPTIIAMSKYELEKKFKRVL